MPQLEKIEENKKRYLDLLLLADPSEEMIDRYIDGDLFILREGDDAVCAAVVYPVSEEECELKNIATSPEHQGKGYGRQMVRHLFEHYKGKFPYMTVGTGNSSVGNLVFYKKCGFEYSHTLQGFFTENYPEPIFEDGVQCVDMVCLRAKL